MYWTLELASKLEDAPWPATKDELIDYAIRSGANLEVIENLQEIEDDEEIFESRCPVWDCDNPEIIHWHHSGCSSYWDLYISSRGMLRCENCGDIDEFVNTTFGVESK